MKSLFIQQSPFVNLGLMSISAALQKNGHTCELLIENLEPNILEEIRKIKPDIIAFSCTTGMHTWAIDLARKIKQRFISIPIVMGAHHPTFFPEVLKYDSIDIICIGEGEESIVDLLNAFEKKQDISKIKNLHVKKKGKIFKNEVRNLIKVLDSLPYADRLLYKKYPFILNQKNFRIITGRGCPYNCTFCFNKSIKELYKNKGCYVRRRSVDNVIDEIFANKKKMHIKRIDFQDDTFIYNYNGWLKPFLNAYKQKINLPFTCCVRANLITDDLCKMLKRAGCFSVKMGIESGNNFLNNQVLGRDLTKQQIRNAVRIMKKNGIKLETFSIIGIPGETVENALETLKFNIELKPEFARCSLLQPYPKTEIEAYAKEHGYLDSDFDLEKFENSYFIDTPIKLENKDQIINLQRLFNVFVRFPFLYPLTKILITLPKNMIYDTLFKVDYALGILLVDKVSLVDFIKFGIHSKGYFKK